MLSNLQVKNFAIAEHVDIDFHAGMTVITGETGAGKSILLDAIALALGDRADSASVGQYGNKTEIIATFNTANQNAVKEWLQARDLDDNDLCILRRVISRDGKSKAYINNRPSPLGDLKSLGEQLINIHGQHSHQSLLKNDEPRRIVDHFGNHHALVSDVRQAYQQWQTQQNRLDELKRQSADSAARVNYLKFQQSELDSIVIVPEELQLMEQELSTLQHAESLINGCETALSLLDGETSGISQLYKAQKCLADLPIKPVELGDSIDLLESARIQLQEASGTINSFIHSLSIDSDRLNELDQKLSAVYIAAKKYHVAPEDLAGLLEDIHQELRNLDNSDETLESLDQEISVLKTNYFKLAEKLTRARQKTATTLKTKIEQRLNLLRMANCTVYFELEPQTASPLGMEKISLKVSTNPGQKPQAIAKVASGGELSRIGLAIQVITAEKNASPAMIFDEVDSGVGGAVAEVVGNLMKELSQTAQIFCVTHLAQVASKAANHYRVEKQQTKTSVKTYLCVLNENQRIEELARMMGGLEITEATLNHAKQMLQTAA